VATYFGQLYGYTQANRAHETSRLRITQQRDAFFYHRFRAKQLCIICSEGVFVALGIEHAKRMRRVVVCGLPSSTVFFHIIS